MSQGRLWLAVVACCLVALPGCPGCGDKSAEQDKKKPAPGNGAAVLSAEMKAVLATLIEAQRAMDVDAALACIEPAAQPMTRDTLVAAAAVRQALLDLASTCVAKGWPEEADLTRKMLDENLWMLSEAVTDGQIDWDEFQVSEPAADQVAAQCGDEEFDLVRIDGRWYVRPAEFEPGQPDAFRQAMDQDKKEWATVKAQLARLRSEVQTGQVSQDDFEDELDEAVDVGEAE